MECIRGDLHAGIEAGDILLERAEDVRIIKGLLEYVTPESLWKVPLMRVVVKLTSGSRPNHSEGFNLHVYTSRLLFYLIADDSLHRIFAQMDAVSLNENILEPLTSVMPQPVKYRVHYPNGAPGPTVSGGSTQSNTSSTVAKKHFAFTLQGVLKNQECVGYTCAKQPRGVVLLYKHCSKRRNFGLIQ